MGIKDLKTDQQPVITFAHLSIILTSLEKTLWDYQFNRRFAKEDTGYQDKIREAQSILIVNLTEDQKIKFSEAFPHLNNLLFDHIGEDQELTV